MPKLYALLAACFLINQTHAQTTTPEVIATAGDHYDNGTNSVSWTLGEPVIQTVSDGNNTLTQGFHQTNLLVDAIGDVAPESTIQVYPNPTADNITIKAEAAGDYESAQLYDASGRLVWAQNESTAPLQSIIDMTSMANGLYVLKIQQLDNSSLDFKILKQ